MSSPSVAPTTVSAPAHRATPWIGFAGSALIAVGGLGAGVLPRPDPWWNAPVLSTMRHGPGPAVCITLAAVGMGLLVFAWWRMRSTSATGAITRAAALWALPLLFGPPMFSRDLYSYATQGLVLARGFDPYRIGPAELPAGVGADWVSSVSSTWAATPAPYGPLYLYLSSRIADAAEGNLISVLLSLRALAVVGIVALALILPRLAAAYGADPARAQWLVVANPLLLIHLIAGGHNEALMLPFLAAAFWVAALATGRTRRVLALGAAVGALVGLSAAVKVSAVVALPFLVVLVAGGPAVGTGRWDLWKRLFGAGAVVVAAAGGAFALASALAGLGLGWIHALAVTSGVSVQWTSIPTGWGLAAGWFTSADDAVLAGARTLGTVLTAVLLVVLWWRVRSASAQRVAGACAAALFLLAILGESFHPWYLVWALVPLAAASEAAPRLATALAVVSGALCFLVLPDGYGLARRTTVPGTVFDLLLTAVAVGYLVYRWRHRDTATPVQEGLSR